MSAEPELSWKQRAIIAESTLVGVRHYGTELQKRWFSRTVATGLLKVIDDGNRIGRELLTKPAPKGASTAEQSR